MLLCLLPLIASCKNSNPDPAAGPEEIAKSDTALFSPDPTQWTTIDALERRIDPEAYPYTRDRKAGIFYFIWHGCHGCDKCPGATSWSA